MFIFKVRDLQITHYLITNFEIKSKYYDCDISTCNKTQNDIEYFWGSFLDLVIQNWLVL